MTNDALNVGQALIKLERNLGNRDLSFYLSKEEYNLLYDIAGVLPLITIETAGPASEVVLAIKGPVFIGRYGTIRITIDSVEFIYTIDLEYMDLFEGFARISEAISQHPDYNVETGLWLNSSMRQIQISKVDGTDLTAVEATLYYTPALFLSEMEYLNPGIDPIDNSEVGFVVDERGDLNGFNGVGYTTIGGQGVEILSTTFEHYIILVCAGGRIPGEINGLRLTIEGIGSRILVWSSSNMRYNIGWNDIAEELRRIEGQNVKCSAEVLS